MPRYSALLTVEAVMSLHLEDGEPVSGFVVECIFQALDHDAAQRTAFDVFQATKMYQEEIAGFIEKIISVDISDVSPVTSGSDMRVEIGQVVLF